MFSRCSLKYCDQYHDAGHLYGIRREPRRKSKKVLFSRREKELLDGVTDWVQQRYTSLCFVETLMTEGANCSSPRCRV
jgi:hypothetical protein